jgi:hypothetical protein
MRTFAVLIASAHICLAACQPAPGGLLPPAPGQGGTSLLANSPPTPYMRCANDFWGNCAGVVSNRNNYRWRYVRPGARPREERESATAREHIARQKAAVRESSAVLGYTKASPAIPPREKAPVRDSAMRDTSVTIRDSSTVCHARRRVVGDERPSRDDARRAAENGWMGAVRYDYGERYQDINRAKDVRHVCGPSSVSAVLKTPHYRCVVEATPCRETKGTPAEPDERRYDPPVEEDRISRR